MLGWAVLILGIVLGIVLTPWAFLICALPIAATLFGDS